MRFAREEGSAGSGRACTRREIPFISRSGAIGPRIVREQRICKPGRQQAASRDNLTISEADLDRQGTISTNTERLLDLLRGEPTLEVIRAESTSLRVGENKGRLLSAYARLNASQANDARERELRSKGLSTEADLLAAQEAFNSAAAEYMAIFEEIDFSYHVHLQQAERAAGTTAAKVTKSTNNRGMNTLLIFQLHWADVLPILKKGGGGVKVRAKTKWRRNGV